MKQWMTCLLLAMAANTAAPAQEADKPIDVSQIIDKAAAETILGEPVKAPPPRNVEGKDGYYSKCNYYSTASPKTLIVRVYQAAPGFDPVKELEMVAENTGAMRAISGLGDKARISTGTQGGLPSHVVMLYVVKGKALITVGIGGLEDESAAGDKTRTIAQKILPHL